MTGIKRADKMEMLEFKHNEEVVARYIPSGAWTDGLGFYSQENESIQVGTWQYDKGKELQKHRHRIVERAIARTQEVLFIVSGSVKAKIYTLDEKFLDEVILSKGDTLILLNCGHGYEILLDNTKVLEVKNGPYPGAEADRKRF